MTKRDDDEYDQFVRARYAALVRAAHMLGADNGRAEDFAQEALLRTFRSWRRLRAPEAAYSYTWVTMLRLIQRSSRRGVGVAIPAEQWEPSAAVDPVVDRLDIRAALATLPIEQRAVVVLRFLEDLTEQQTADLLGCPVGTVKSRTSRGLAALRSRLSIPSSHQEIP